MTETILTGCLVLISIAFTVAICAFATWVVKEFIDMIKND